MKLVCIGFFFFGVCACVILSDFQINVINLAHKNYLEVLFLSGFCNILNSNEVICY